MFPYTHCNNSVEIAGTKTGGGGVYPVDAGETEGG
jgi:hypothetical protein